MGNSGVQICYALEGYLGKRPQAKGVELDELVNQLLKREIEIIEGGE